MAEQQIFELETAYIDETSSYGNLIKGWADFANIKVKPPQVSFFQFIF